MPESPHGGNLKNPSWSVTVEGLKVRLNTLCCFDICHIGRVWAGLAVCSPPTLLPHWECHSQTTLLEGPGTVPADPQAAGFSSCRATKSFNSGNHIFSLEPGDTLSSRAYKACLPQPLAVHSVPRCNLHASQHTVHILPHQALSSCELQAGSPVQGQVSVFDPPHNPRARIPPSFTGWIGSN